MRAATEVPDAVFVEEDMQKFYVVLVAK